MEHVEVEHGRGVMDVKEPCLSRGHLIPSPLLSFVFHCFPASR